MSPPAGPAKVLLVAVVATAALASARPALAAERATAAMRCLSAAEQRVRTASQAVVPLSKAMRAAKAKRGEVVRASLCERNGKLVYRLTVLRGGSVVSTIVDAGNGAVIADR